MIAAEAGWRAADKTIDGINVVLLDLGSDPDRKRQASVWLDAVERDRWEKFLAARQRIRFALCRAALRSHLCERNGWENERLSFEYGANGLPLEAGFHARHNGSHGLIAFAPCGQVGVDIQKRRKRPDLDGISRMVFGRNEQAAVLFPRGADKVDLFCRIWTIKEALIKLIGTGFSPDPSTFEIPPSMLQCGKSASFRFAHAPTNAWRVAELGERRLAAAIAYEGKLSASQ